MMPRAAIAGYHQDESGTWVAELDCGHTQHLRHHPPWQSRPWVTTEEGRRERLGTLLDCPACRMPSLPDGVVEYKRTADFDEAPAGLRKSHTLKAGVWGQIVVLEGHVLYVLEDEANFMIALHPGLVGTIAPERPHHVEPQPGSRFFVRFLRAGD
jgi:tellurite methyltransferase